MSRVSGEKLEEHWIEVRTFRHRTGWTFTVDVDNAGEFSTDRTYITRQSAIEAATLRLLRELPPLFELDLIEQVPCQVRGS